MALGPVSAEYFGFRLPMLVPSVASHYLVWLLRASSLNNQPTVTLISEI